MEQALGRPLHRHEHVHHKNGDRLDNRPENLEVVSPNAHRQRHVKYFRDETHKECAGCHQVLPRTHFGRQAPRPGRADDPHISRCRPCWVLYTTHHKSPTEASVDRNA